MYQNVKLNTTEKNDTLIITIKLALFDVKK